MQQTAWLARTLLATAGFGWLAAATAVTAPPPNQVTSAQAPALRLNTLGYLPAAPKRATIARPGDSFAVVRVGDGKRVLEGPITGPARNEDTDEELYVADFSALTEPGEYRLEVPNVGESAPFRIAADLYREPFRTVTRAMYLMRCGKIGRAHV